MFFLAKFWLQSNIKIYYYNCSLNNMLFSKSYFGYIIYILFFAILNELIFKNAKLWSIFGLLVFAYAVINFVQLCVITSGRFIYNNKSYIVNKPLNFYSLFDTVI